MGGFNDIRKMGSVCKYQMKLQFAEMKTRAIFLLLCVYLMGVISPIKEFAAVVGQKISPWLFPVLMNDLVCSLVIFCFWSFLVCDTPFQNEGYLYYAGRSGKVNWIVGEILFLISFSGLYMLIVYLVTLAVSLPYLMVTEQWGKVLGTLAYTDAVAQFPMAIQFPVSVMSGMSPITAAIYSFLLSWVTAFLLGLSILFVNWCFRSSMGAALALFWILLDLTANNLLDHVWLKYSPVSLSKLSNLMGRYRYLNVSWMLRFIGGMTLLLLLGIFFVTRRRKGME